MKERIRNRFITAGLATTMLFVGVTVFDRPTRGIEPSSNPIPSVEPSPTPEVAKLELSAFMEQIKSNINTDIDPKFFRRMEKRALNRPNEFFTQTEIPGGFAQLYFPDGLGTEVKVGYIHTVTNGVGNNDNGVPAGLNFFQTDNEIRLQLGEDGELASSSNMNLFNFDQLERFTLKDFKEPAELQNVEWTRVQANAEHYAYTYREFKDDTNQKLLLATQTGMLVLANSLTEIPIVGTDQVPLPELTIVFGN